MNTLTKNNRWATVSLIAAILLVAMNLRVPFTGVAPVLPWIQHDFSLSTTAVGLLTSLPLLAFAAFSPFSASIAASLRPGAYPFRRIGRHCRWRCSSVPAAVLDLVRRDCTDWRWYCLGKRPAASLIKRDFPANLVSLTGAYSITMGVAGAIGSAAVIPLTQAWGWRASLAMFVIVPLVALLAWLPQWKKQGKAASSARRQAAGVAVWRSPLAWQVSYLWGSMRCRFISLLAGCRRF